MEQMKGTGTTRNSVIVFISGVAGSGKSTAANYLCNKMNELYGGGLFRAVIYPLAQPIKEIALNFFGWDGKKDEKGRRLLQVLGTEAGRNYKKDLWCQYLLSKVEENIIPPSFIFVDDWRFPDEASFFEEYPLFDVVRIRITRNVFDEDRTYSHESETSLPQAEHEYLNNNTDLLYNYSVFNNGNLEEFYKKLDVVFHNLTNKIFFPND